MVKIKIDIIDMLIVYWLYSTFIGKTVGIPMVVVLLIFRRKVIVYECVSGVVI